MRRRGAGRIREKLAKLLGEKGILVDPEDLWTQEGAYRSVHWDLARWGTMEAKFKDGKAPDGTDWHQSVQLSSWSTMTDCCKYGIDIGKEDEFGLWNWVGVEHAGTSN